MSYSVRWTTLIITILAAWGAFAQQTTGPEPAKNATFVSHSQLVLVPVIVTDGKGRPIAGLKKESFRLEENGKPQVVKIFEEVTTEKMTPAATSPQMQARPGFSNVAAIADPHPRRVTILVLDLLNTPVTSQARTRKQLIKYLSSSLDSNEPITLLGFSQNGLQQLHSFTTDTKLLIDALNKLSNKFSIQDRHGVDVQPLEPPPTDSSTTDPGADELAEFLQVSSDTMQAFKDREAARKTLSALNQVALAFSGIPGRKTLIWASSGFPFMIDDPKEFGYMGLDMVDSYESTWRNLITENIAVYPLDVEGLVGPDMSAPNLSPGIAIGRSKGSQANTVATRDVKYDRHAEQMDTMRAFAGATGGNACFNSNDLAKCVKRAVDDSRSYYLLGFYISPDDRTPGWRKLKVHVASDGIRVRARDGFYVGNPPKDDEPARKAALMAGLTSPVEFTGIPINVQWTSRVKLTNTIKGVTSEKTSAGFVITLPPGAFVIAGADHAMNLVVAAIAFDRKGVPVAEFSKRVQSKLAPEVFEHAAKDGFTYHEKMSVPAGTTLVRFIVRDNNSGEMGSVNARFDP
jgi:VWFA-related protein